MSPQGLPGIGRPQERGGAFDLCRTREHNRSRSASSHRTTARSVSKARFASDSQAPPPVDRIQGAPSSRRAMTALSFSREKRLAVALEDLGDGQLRRGDDLGIRVGRISTPSRAEEHRPTAVLPAPHHTHQHDRPQQAVPRSHRRSFHANVAWSRP